MNDNKARAINSIKSSRPGRRALRSSGVAGLAIAPLLLMGVGSAVATEVPAGQTPVAASVAVPVAQPTTDPTSNGGVKLSSDLNTTSPSVAAQPGALLAQKAAKHRKNLVHRPATWSKEDVAVRNKRTYAKAQPLWVQQPVLVRDHKRYALVASASARAFRVTRKGPDLHGKSKKDRLDLEVLVTRTGNLRDGRPASLIAKSDKALEKRVTKSQSRHGVVSFSVPVSRALGKKLARLSAAELSQRTSITLTHRKDTFTQTVGHEFQQIVTASMVKKRLSKKGVRKAVARNATAARQLETNNKTRGGLPQPAFQNIEFQNNTPFTQTLTFQPYGQCMMQGFPAPIGPITLGPVNSTASFAFGAVYGGTANAVGNWLGAGQGMYASANPGALGAEVAQTAANTLRSLDGSNPDFFTEDGLESAAIYAGVEFSVGLLKDLLDNPNECDNFGQYWHASSAAVGLDLNNVYGTPAGWATATTSASPGTSDLVTSPQNAPDSLPAAGSLQLANLDGVLQSALGMMTSATYFHNAGMPAPISGVPGHTNWQGTMSWSQGMTQVVYPNPAECVGGDCNNADTAIQLLYVVNGAENPFGPALNNLPTVTATTSPDVQDPTVKQLDLQCNFEDGGSWISPYGGTHQNPTNGDAIGFGSLMSAQGVTSAQYAVAYYAQNAAGDYLYNSASVGPNYPAGNLGSGVAALPALGPNAGQQLVDMSTPELPQATLSQTDLNNLVDVDGDPQQPTQFGCAITPFVGWQNMAINGSSPAPQYGTNWPFPNATTGTPLSPGNEGKNPFNDPNPVNAINLTWQGDMYPSLPVVLDATGSVVSNTVTSIRPTSGPVRGLTNVTVTGSGFQTGATVTIGGVPCTNAVAVNSSTITCVTGAAQNAGNNGIVNVQNPGGAGASSGSGLFAYAASVSSVSPNSGALEGGTAITISGSGFAPNSTVEIGGVSCTSPVFVNSTTITCTTGVSPGGSDPVDVSVTNPYPFSTSTLARGFLFGTPVSVASVSPEHDSTVGGASITITGTAFAAGATATVGSAPCTSVSVVNSTQLTCTTGANAVGAADVTVTIPSMPTGWTTATLAGGFQFFTPVTATSVSPAQGLATGGSTITVSGTGFLAGATVQVGAAPCTSVSVVNTTTLTCVAGASATGAADVSVTVPSNPTASNTAMLAGGFEFTDFEATSVSPANGSIAGGTGISISGEGFSAGAIVEVGGVPCTQLEVVTSTEISCLTGAHAAGTADVIVTIPGKTGASNAVVFNYLPVTVTSVTGSGGPEGGWPITIHGTGFVSDMIPVIPNAGWAPCTNIDVVNSTTITCNTPPMPGQFGYQGVFVQSGSLDLSVDAEFVVKFALRSITPSSGTSAGGTVVTISGMDGWPGTPTVTIGGVPCTSVSAKQAADTTFTCTTGAHAAGVVDVVVNGAGTSLFENTLTGGFTYE